jgi:hypothetical protein
LQFNLLYLQDWNSPEVGGGAAQTVAARRGASGVNTLLQKSGRSVMRISMADPELLLHCGSGLTSHPAVESSRDAFRQLHQRHRA